MAKMVQFQVVRESKTIIHEEGAATPANPAARRETVVYKNLIYGMDDEGSIWLHDETGTWKAAAGPLPGRW